MDKSGEHFKPPRFLVTSPAVDIITASVPPQPPKASPDTPAVPAPAGRKRNAWSAWLAPERNSGIDLLRGLSISMVVSSHFGLIGWLTHEHTRKLWGRTVDDIGNGLGYYGVTLFFVISGYLITTLSLRRYGILPRIALAEFWWFRFARIMPTLLLCLLAMVVLHLTGTEGFAFADVTALTRGLTALLSFQFNEVIGSPGIPAIWNPLWSLSVEEMFYLVFPLVCRCLTGAGAVLWMGVAAVSASLYFRITGGSGPFSTWGCAHLLALGCLTALARPDRLRARLQPEARPRVAGTLATAGIGSIAVTVVALHPFATNWGPLLCGLGAVALIVAAQTAELPAGLRLATAPLAILGVVSYEAYLIHLPAQHLLMLAGINQLALHLPLLAAAAVLLHVYFSEPLNQWLRRRRPGRADQGA